MSEPKSAHRCHARRCEEPVPPKMFMCRRHWYMVPSWIRSSVWEHYRPGQEVDKKPSENYMAVTRAAIDAVAAKETRDA